MLSLKLDFSEKLNYILVFSPFYLLQLTFSFEFLIKYFQLRYEGEEIPNDQKIRREMLKYDSFGMMVLNIPMFLFYYAFSYYFQNFIENTILFSGYFMTCIILFY
jgi:hypothetical protein